MWLHYYTPWVKWLDGKKYKIYKIIHFYTFLYLFFLNLPIFFPKILVFIQIYTNLYIFIQIYTFLYIFIRIFFEFANIFSKNINIYTNLYKFIHFYTFLYTFSLNF